MPTLLDPEHVAALMSPGVDADDLVLVIEREEDWLANDPVDGIGQLVGERVDTIWVTPGDARPLLLRRPTASVEVVDGGVALAADDDPPARRYPGRAASAPGAARPSPSPPRRSTSRRSSASSSSSSASPSRRAHTRRSRRTAMPTPDRPTRA